MIVSLTLLHAFSLLEPGDGLDFDAGFLREPYLEIPLTKQNYHLEWITFPACML
jgi:hypothetical protein